MALEISPTLDPAVGDHDLNNILYGSTSSPADRKYWPYGSQAMCILDILDNIPQAPVSTTLMKLFIWALRELGVPNVLSFHGLQKIQEQLRQAQGVSNLECKSVQGKIFYINDIRKVVAQDWLNPLVRPHIHVYPVVSDDGCVSEVWHADKWHKTLDIDLLSPMYDAGTKHFYIHELACQQSGNLLVPIRWIINKGIVCADAYTITLNEHGEADVQSNGLTRIAAQSLEMNYLDLAYRKMIPKWSGSSMAAGFPLKMPNKYRAIAQGNPLYVSFIDYFGDDVSENHSKSWNKHNNSYIMHRNLPRKLLQQEYHVHLISTSQHASIPEQYQDVKKLIDSTRRNPVKDPAIILPKVMLQVTLVRPGIILARSVKWVVQKLSEQGVRVFMQSSGFSELRHEHTDNEAHNMLMAWVREHESEIYNSFLTTDGTVNLSPTFPDLILIVNRIGFDPAWDTTVEILHTILLGVVKYIWHYSTKMWSSSQKTIFSQRLQATSTDGLSIAKKQAEYIINYSNSLTGRQFQQVVQTAVFHVYDLVDDNHFIAWKAVGHLAALLWQPEINDIKQYCSDVDVAAANVQDAFAVIDPTKILQKYKLHLFSHLLKDIREFGPLIGVATETFESYNSVFRSCSVLSNHLAPSHNITRQIGSQGSLKHRLSGGRWYDTQRKEWTQAGKGVQQILRSHKVLQTMLGWSTKDELHP
ncbi:hypothetical protein PQX77_003285, partial [Marasmius sp. AFHP31]